MSSIDLNVSPWAERQDHSVRCLHCEQAFVFHIDPLNAHTVLCPWRAAYIERNEYRRNSMVREFIKGEKNVRISVE